MAKRTDARGGSCARASGGRAGDTPASAIATAIQRTCMILWTRDREPGEESSTRTIARGAGLRSLAATREHLSHRRIDLALLRCGERVGAHLANGHPEVLPIAAHALVELLEHRRACMVGARLREGGVVDRPLEVELGAQRLGDLPFEHELLGVAPLRRVDRL